MSGEKLAKWLLAGSLLAWTVFAAGGEGAAPAEKPAKPADQAKAGTWFTDYTQAVAAAKELKRPILLDFTGSDWCGWCMKLKAEVFTQKAFTDYAAENLVLMEVDFPRNKPQTAAQKKSYAKLSDKYQIEGYPTVVLVRAVDGKELARTGYQEGGPEKYVASLKALLKGRH